MIVNVYQISTVAFALNSVPNKTIRKINREIRRIKILDYAYRYSKRTDTEKDTDFKEIDEEQAEWVKKRITAPAWTWQTWDGVIQEWTPWNSFGEPINQWRCYKK